ncbi:hypothetical protein [Kitasatospora sp. DSM 101779]|uniref:hypothetical protein n=1 Tax=Kitasatospora sp. DSM 101779 TaxID=2853165 RepID=UPI0021D9551B|nr:hypothetical protein [Kitasatospora sp. DSM 101779]MCU7827379.1 hypothetical protein [Kitasatospora sp. DSM 101779]
MIHQQDLVGDWANAQGAVMHVAADRTLTAENIDSAEPHWKCSPTVTRAAWQFMVSYSGEGSYSSQTATKGDSFTVDVRPTNVNGEPTDLRCSFSADVRRDDRGYNLCLVEDPDETCTDHELMRKVPAPPR